LSAKDLNITPALAIEVIAPRILTFREQHVIQFEAMAQLSPEEKSVARAVLEGLLLKHAAWQWNSNPSPAGT
jgi:hypothetical protein